MSGNFPAAVVRLCGSLQDLDGPFSDAGYQASSRRLQNLSGLCFVRFLSYEFLVFVSFRPEGRFQLKLRGEESHSRH